MEGKEIKEKSITNLKNKMMKWKIELLYRKDYFHRRASVERCLCEKLY